MVRISVQEASWTPPLASFLGMSNQAEPQDQTLVTLERFHLFAGLRPPRYVSEELEGVTE